MLLQQLSGSVPCSGEKLGHDLGITRAAVWKMVQELRRQGFVIRSHPGQGYCLQSPMQWLQPLTISAALWQAGVRVQVQRQTTSTNQEVLQAFSRQEGHALAVLAEQQTAGRGRRGRTWLSPLAQNFYGSLGWRFDRAASALAGLSLSIGVGVAEALEPLLGRKLGLKWPNDIILEQGKLGGILIELAGDASGPCDVVIGLGLNHLGFASGTTPDQPCRQLHDYLQIERTELAVLLLRALVDTVRVFEGEGLPAFADGFIQRDVLLHQPVCVQRQGQGDLYGWGSGIAADGSMLLERQGQTVLINSGEVSVRVAAATGLGK